MTQKDTFKVESVLSRISNDPQLKAMKLLLEAQKDEAKKIEIQKFIDKRIKELREDNVSS